MLARALYRLLTRLAAPLVFGYLYWRGRAEPAYRRHWGERLGRIPARIDAPIWLHAASVGEVALVAPLAERLAADAPLLITVMTPTGRAEARRRLGAIADIGYLPLDTPGAARRFIARVAPRLGVLVETELWPNLLAAARRVDVPMALINATVSPRSAARYARWPASVLMADALAGLELVAAARAADGERFATLGAMPERLAVVGNLKYDLCLPSDLESQAVALRAGWDAVARPIWVAASTHDDEERRLLDVFAELRLAQPDLLLVIAPRHPQRFDAVAALLAETTWRVARRSGTGAVDGTTDILLADTLGELLLFYAAADVVFVGGSLVPGIGGHNVIEAAAAGRVLVTGPHADDWAPALAVMAPAGALSAPDMDGLTATLAGWLADPSQRARLGAANAQGVAAHRGAIARTRERLGLLLGRAPGPA